MKNNVLVLFCVGLFQPIKMRETSKFLYKSYVDKCSWCTTPYTGRRGRRPRRHWSRRTVSCCCTTYTLSCCWCTRCRWTSWRKVSGTAWHCGWLRNKTKGTCSHVTSQWKSNLFPFSLCTHLAVRTGCRSLG